MSSSSNGSPARALREALLERARRHAPDLVHIARGVLREVERDELIVLAAALAFYAVLGLFPGLIALLSLYGLFADTADAQAELGWLATLMPPGAGRIFREQLAEIAAGSLPGYGLRLVASVLAVLWSASTGVSALLKGVSLAYFAEETRSFLRLRLLALLTTVGAIAVLATGLFVVAALPLLLSWLLPESVIGPAVSIGRWPLLALSVMGGLELLYRYGPDRDREDRERPGTSKLPSPGAWLATGTWLAASFGFSAYVQHFGTFNATYGALGAVVALLLWLWITAFSTLLGAELNAVLERRARAARRAEPSDRPTRDATSSG